MMLLEVFDDLLPLFKVELRQFVRVRDVDVLFDEEFDQQVADGLLRRREIGDSGVSLFLGLFRHDGSDDFHEPAEHTVLRAEVANVNLGLETGQSGLSNIAIPAVLDDIFHVRFEILANFQLRAELRAFFVVY